MPNGTSVRKIASYKGIIHNCNWFSVIGVVVVEKPSSQQRDPHSLEISSTHNPLGGIQNLVRQERAPFDGKEHLPTPTADWKIGCQPSGCDFWELPQVFQEAIVKRDYVLRIGLRYQHKRQVACFYTLRSKSWVYVDHFPQAASKQSSAGQ
jgi:hypothetical protein